MRLAFFLFLFLGVQKSVVGQCPTRIAGDAPYEAISANGQYYYQYNPYTYGYDKIAGLQNSGTWSNVQSNSSSSCFKNNLGYGFASKDIYYTFTLLREGRVKIVNTGSNNTGNFRTFVALFKLDPNNKSIVLGYSNQYGSQSSSLNVLDTLHSGSSAYTQATIVRDLPAGTYYVVSLANGSDEGDITTSITLTEPTYGVSLNVPLLIPPMNLSNTTSYNSYNSNDPSTWINNYKSNGHYNSIGQSGNDIYYEFPLTSRANVHILSCNAAFPTEMFLLDSAGNQLVYTNGLTDPQGSCSISNPSQAAINYNLDPGTYYIVQGAIPGTSHPDTGYINLQINLTNPTVSANPNYYKNYSATLPAYVNNYILTNTMRVSGITQATPDTLTTFSRQQKVIYYDGLGRPIQEVDAQASPGKRDIVTPVAYDQTGKEIQKYLPYVATLANSNGGYKPTAFTDQASFYANPSGSTWNAPNIDTTSAPYSQSIYEPSPLQRVVEQGAPGTTWQPGPNRTNTYGRTVLISYTSNTNSNGIYKVRLYTAISSHNDYTRTLTDGGWYGADSLYLTINKDENWTSDKGKGGTVEEYKNRDGQVILKRQWLTDTTPLSTYYVYDDLGNLSFVLPPGAKPDSVWTPNQVVINNLCYQYQYDGRKRLIQKKIPGKGWELIVYNKLDQVVLTQDSVQRKLTQQQASFIKYDAQGRVIMTGTCTFGAYDYGNYRANLQALADAQTVLWETKNTSGVYSNNTLPTTGATVLVTNYYDDYNIPNLPSAYTAPTGASAMTKGLLTASIVSVLNTPADLLWTVNYYDDLGRVIKAYKQHYLGGTGISYSTNNYDAITNNYDFTNALTQTVRWHFTKASTTVPALVVGNTYDYDHMGRKLHTGEQIYLGSTPGDPVYISLTKYNELGQKDSMFYHHEDGMPGYLGACSYSYNERGWLTAITPISSGNYSEVITYNGGPNPQYNGNISQFTYNAPYMNAYNSYAQNYMKTVNYTYDNLNRLQQSSSALPAKLDETVTYDAMGNITNLVRTGQTTGPNAYAGTYAYTYNQLTSQINSNQLSSVTKNGTIFKSFTYDGNGNAITDTTNRTLSYNMLNLPLAYKSGSNTLVTYYYDADGNKLRNVSAADGNWDYINGIIYHNGSVAFIQTEEGKAMPTSAGYVSSTGAFGYVYEFKDYLGNVRASFDNDGIVNHIPRIIQENDYFPFGLSTLVYDSSNGNRYLYNGKEKQADLKNQYDYGARFYDPVIARWTSIDPLSEKNRRFTPYAYGDDDPINNVDVDGNFSINNHYAYTNKALTGLGYNKKTSDLVSHYASVYSDHPPTKVMVAEMASYRKGIDYSGTAQSQNTASPLNSSWHSMAADGEKISSSAALARGQAFGWGKIIAASGEIKKAGGIENLKANSAGIQELGQGIHALQDGVAHQGTDMAHHSTWNDVYPSDQEVAKAAQLTNSALISAEVLSGDYSHVTNGMTIDLTGTTQEQYNTIKAGFQKAIDVSDKDNLNKVYFTGGPKKQ